MIIGIEIPDHLFNRLDEYALKKIKTGLFEPRKAPLTLCKTCKGRGHSMSVPSCPDCDGTGRVQPVRYVTTIDYFEFSEPMK